MSLFSSLSFFMSLSPKFSFVALPSLLNGKIFLVISAKLNSLKRAWSPTIKTCTENGLLFVEFVITSSLLMPRRQYTKMNFQTKAAAKSLGKSRRQILKDKQEGYTPESSKIGGDQSLTMITRRQLIQLNLLGHFLGGVFVNYMQDIEFLYDVCGFPPTKKLFFNVEHRISGTERDCTSHQTWLLTRRGLNFETSKGGYLRIRM